MAFLRLGKDQHIYYRRISGKPERPYLVFLHEGLGCVAMWKDFPDQLCRATRCPGLVYDRLGFGMSSPLTQQRRLHYLHVSALVELVTIIDALLPDQPYCLVGHSDGASIALIHAAERPGQLRGIVTEAPHVMVEPKTLEGIRETVRTFDDRKHRKLMRYHGDKSQHVFDAWHQIWLSQGFRSWNIEYLLPSVQCPCLIIHGQDDPYGTDQHIQVIASKLAGPAQVEMIAGCGHAPHHEANTMAHGLMVAFIDAMDNP